MASELVCRVYFWCNRHCKTNPVDLDGFGAKALPKIAKHRHQMPSGTQTSDGDASPGGPVGFPAQCVKQLGPNVRAWPMKSSGTPPGTPPGTVIPQETNIHQNSGQMPAEFGAAKPTTGFGTSRTPRTNASNQTGPVSKSQRRGSLRYVLACNGKRRIVRVTN